MEATQLQVELFDARQCTLGEGPVASGLTHSEVQWVDIEGKRVLSRNIESGATGEYEVDELVAFVIPTESGKDLLGTTNGPVIYDGRSFTPYISRDEADITPMRWNDAKVSPDGDLWLGSLALSEESGYGSFYRLDGRTRELKKYLSGTGISNGLAWSSDKKTFYYIDTLTFGIDAFDYSNREISNRRQVIPCDTQYGFPDGMSIDSEDGLWVAFYNGGAVRRYDTRNNFALTHEISVPALRTTSCAFAGKNLEKLIITSAERNSPSSTADDGRTYICETGFTGLPSTPFAGA
jgi:gluconolactonase